MYVQSAPPKGSKRIFRKHFCLFCKTWQSKIGRYLERKHKTEKRVKEFTDLNDLRTDLRKKVMKEKHLLTCYEKMEIFITMLIMT